MNLTSWRFSRRLEAAGPAIAHGPDDIEENGREKDPEEGYAEHAREDGQAQGPPHFSAGRADCRPRKMAAMNFVRSLAYFFFATPGAR